MKARRNLDNVAVSGTDDAATRRRRRRRAAGAILVRNDARDEFLDARGERRSVGVVAVGSGSGSAVEAEAKLHRRSRLSVETDLADVVDAVIKLLEFDVNEAGIEAGWFRFGHSEDVLRDLVQQIQRKAQ